MENTRPTSYRKHEEHRIYYVKYYWGEQRVRQLVDAEEIAQLLTLLRAKRIANFKVEMKPEKK